jgi:hypothetical protein
MATFNKSYNFTQDLLSGVHTNLLTANLRFALSNILVNANDTHLATDITEIASYAFVSTPSGDGAASRLLQSVSVTQDDGLGTADFKCLDLTITANGGAIPQFQYMVLYNDDATNDEIIGWLDYGSPLDLADGESLLVDFATTGLFTLA